MTSSVDAAGPFDRRLGLMILIFSEFPLPTSSCKESARTGCFTGGALPCFSWREWSNDPFHQGVCRRASCSLRAGNF